MESENVISSGCELCSTSIYSGMRLIDVGSKNEVYLNKHQIQVITNLEYYSLRLVLKSQTQVECFAKFNPLRQTLKVEHINRSNLQPGNWTILLVFRLKNIRNLFG